MRRCWHARARQDTYIHALNELLQCTWHIGSSISFIGQNPVESPVCTRIPVRDSIEQIRSGATVAFKRSERSIENMQHIHVIGHVHVPI